MKFLLISSIIFTQTLFAIGALGIKNLNLSYVNGAGSADFDQIHIRTGLFDININEFKQIDLDYKDNTYIVRQRLGGKSDVNLNWKLDESTAFLKDISNNVIIQANKPVNLWLGTRKTRVNIPHFAVASEKSAFEAKNINIACDYSDGKESVINYMLHVLKACLVNSHFKVDSLVSRQEEQQDPLISNDFDDVLSEAKHPLAQKTGIDLDQHRTVTKDKQLLDKFDLKIINSQAFMDMQIKVWNIPLRVEFYGPVRLLEKSKQIRVNVQEFKILGVNFSDVLIKMVHNFLKKYQSDSIKVDYPYLYLNVDGLYSSDDE